MAENYLSIGEVGIESGQVVLFDPDRVTEWQSSQGTGIPLFLKIFGQDADNLASLIVNKGEIAITKSEDIYIVKDVSKLKELKTCIVENKFRCCVWVITNSYYDQTSELTSSMSEGGELGKNGFAVVFSSVVGEGNFSLLKNEGNLLFQIEEPEDDDKVIDTRNMLFLGTVVSESGKLAFSDPDYLDNPDGESMVDDSLMKLVDMNKPGKYDVYFCGRTRLNAGSVLVKYQT